MAFLFVVENGVAKPTTEALLISPYKEIWDRDVSEDKTRATRDFCFIEFMTSKKITNPYAGYDDNIRFDKLKEIYFPDSDPDSLIEQGMAKMVEFQTEASATYSYYTAVLEGAQKMKQFFRTFDMNETNDRGVKIWKPKDITSAMVDTDKVLQNMNAMKQRVEQELFEHAKTRGNRQINYFEQ